MRASIARLASSYNRRSGKAAYSTAITSTPAADQWNAVVEWRDGDRQRQPRPGPLSGWRTTVKMNICTAELNTTCSSRMLQGWNAGYDATAVDKLQRAGAEIVGKTNCDEFGMGCVGSLGLPKSRGLTYRTTRNQIGEFTHRLRSCH